VTASIDNPLLSIVIPVYNRQEGLNILLSALLKAMDVGDYSSSIEIIVIDDCSQKTITIPKLPCDILLERNKKNLGAPLSRERGFKASTGKFVHFHDSDDSVTENWLSGILLALRKNLNTDILMTARIDRDQDKDSVRVQKYFHNKVLRPKKIKTRLVYRNCMGPLGGVTFSREVLNKTRFMNFASCQDWQMYLDAIKHSKELMSLKDTYFIFNKCGKDRISLNARKKILGHSQLSKITRKESLFKKNIRLFYLVTCQKHVLNKGGRILKLFKGNRFRIMVTYVSVSLYWRLF